MNYKLILCNKNVPYGPCLRENENFCTCELSLKEIFYVNYVHARMHNVILGTLNSVKPVQIASDSDDKCKIILKKQ